MNNVTNPCKFDVLLSLNPKMNIAKILPHLTELLQQLPRNTPQAFRPVYRNPPHSTLNSTHDILYITPQLDPDLGRSIIYWKDIQAHFEDALYIKNKVVITPFLKDSDHKIREPLRIGVAPEVIFDVYMENPLQEEEEENTDTNSIVEDLNIMEIADSIETHMSISLNSQSSSIIDTTRKASHNGLSGMELTLEKAKNGNKESQFDLGVIYEIRLQDFSKAAEWYFKAADQGHASAQYRIGHLYDIGCGVPKDCSKAVEWYLKASGQHDPIAQNAIGIYYYEGSGLPQDHKKAHEWYLKSAAQGYSNAQRNIGLLFHDGEGVERDYVKAMEWYLLSADQGNSYAQNSIATLYDGGYGVAQDYHKAMEWYIKAAEQGENYALKNIGDLFDAGGEHAQASKWYMKSAIEGNAGAQKHMGYRYRSGRGVPQDCSESFKWFYRAAMQGCSQSQHCIGKLYSEWGLPQNYTKAAEWFHLAIKSKGIDRIYPEDDLAELYMNGYGVPKDFRISKDLIKKFKHTRSSFKRAQILEKKQH